MFTDNICDEHRNSWLTVIILFWLETYSCVPYNKISQRSVCEAVKEKVPTQTLPAAMDLLLSAYASQGIDELAGKETNITWHNSAFDVD